MTSNLINRLQNYTLNRKIISIESDDREISKWPNSNEFEVAFPQIYNNIESIRLLNINIPNKLYNIASNLENNKMQLDNSNIIITDGIYNIQLLTDKLNSIFNYQGLDYSANYYEYIHKIIITSNNEFTLDFNIDSSNNCDINSNSKYNKYGLGTILGFNDLSVNSKLLSNTEYSELISINDFSYIIVPPNQCNLGENRYIYMEIENFNTCDELIPNLSSNINYFNRNNGKVNSYFAKIPIINNSNNQSLSGKSNYTESLSYYQPPIKKMSKLKFKFRYHNGTLVDFHNYNISFDLEINEIRNEIKNYNVRLPFAIS
tara:strand:+ start:33 stop:983 length:951 start_codon:yes stop_codon:yes gene_type:complete